MAIYLNPWDNPEAWDQIILGDDLEVPGLALVGDDWSRENTYDIKEGKGTAGASETLKAQPPAKGSITFKVWTRAQMLAWDPVLDALRFNPSAALVPAVVATTAANTSTGFPVDTGAAAANPPSLGKDSAIAIFHPALADIDVHFVLPPEKLGIWARQDDFSFTRKIDFVEFTQPGAQSIAATPTGAAPVAQGQTAPAGGAEAPAALNGAAAGGASAGGAQGAWGAS